MFIFLGAFLKRGTECPIPLFPLSLPLSRKGGRWPRNDHGDHSMTYCNCPGKRRLMSSMQVVRGVNEKGWDSGNSGGRARGLTDNMRERRMEDESEVLLLTPSGCSLPSQRTPTGTQALMGSGHGRGSEDVCFSQDEPTTPHLCPHRISNS